MKVVTTIREMQQEADRRRREGLRIGVVPTMGYLHEGHLSLIRIARQHADVVVTTIFVNPTQFGPNEDFAKYPRDLDRDKGLADSAGTDILFTPTEKEMYPNNYLTYVEVEKITKLLEGKFRPMHFRGVSTVVAKLFNIVKPHIAVFGQKDAQQAVVIRQMIRDLDFDVDLVVAPIVREQDGLAMSSRNVYLSPTERSQGTVLFESLKLAERIVQSGERDCSVVTSKMKDLITSRSSATIDYISIADQTTLDEAERLKPGDSVLVSLAVRFPSVRLIDDIIIKV